MTPLEKAIYDAIVHTANDGYGACRLCSARGYFSKIDDEEFAQNVIRLLDFGDVTTEPVVNRARQVEDSIALSANPVCQS
jgi:hypothetical protein